MSPGSELLAPPAPVAIHPGRDFLDATERARLAALAGQVPHLLVDPGPYPVLVARDLLRASDRREYRHELATSIVYAVARGEDVRAVAQAFTAAVAEELAERTGEAAA